MIAIDIKKSDNKSLIALETMLKGRGYYDSGFEFHKQFPDCKKTWVEHWKAKNNISVIIGIYQAQMVTGGYNLDADKVVVLPSDFDALVDFLNEFEPTCKFGTKKGKKYISKKYATV